MIVDFEYFVKEKCERMRESVLAATPAKFRFFWNFLRFYDLITWPLARYNCLISKISISVCVYVCVCKGHIVLTHSKLALSASNLLRPPFHRPFIESCYSRATTKSNSFFPPSPHFFPSSFKTGFLSIFDYSL